MEGKAKYVTATPIPRFYPETCTLAEHKLLKRVRQISNSEQRTILIFEIINRHDLRELGRVTIE